jgi:ADP-ribosylation factor-like protein 3
LLVLANKQDAPGALAAVEIKERLGLGRHAGRACDVQPCSALNGDGLKTAAEWLVSRVKSSRRSDVVRRKGT